MIEYIIMRRKTLLAASSGPDHKRDKVRAMAVRYAVQNAQDGPVEVFIKGQKTPCMRVDKHGVFTCSGT